MAEYRNDKLGVRFEVADTITVRKQLAYRSARQFLSVEDTYAAHWRAALLLIEGWQCETVPDPKALDLDAVTDPQMTYIVLWAAGEVAGHVAGLDSVPKASLPPSATA